MNIPPVSIAAAKAALIEQYADPVLRRRATMLWGSRGVGKSSIVRQVAEHFGVPLVDLRLTTIEPVDIRGAIYADDELERTVWFPPEFLPAPDQPDGILFLDELTAADQRLRISAYSLILDRRVGRYRLPDGWQVVAAGNASFHGAVSHDMGTVLADRMFHFNVQTVIDAFLAHALAMGFAPEVMAFLRVRPDKLDDTQAQLAGDHLVGASPRGWEDISNVLKSGLSEGARRLFVQGRIGAANAAEFFGVLRELQAGADVLALQAGWVAHEVLHVALRHPQRLLELQQRLGDVDHRLFNLCADAIVDSALGHLNWLELPAGVVALDALLAAGRPADLRPDAQTPAPPEVQAEQAREWRERLLRAHAGDGAHSMLRVLLADLPRTRTPWEQALRTPLARGLSLRPGLSWSRPARSYIANQGRSGPHRRMPWEPGTTATRQVPRLAVIVDVSGSIEDALMERFAREIESITRRLEAALVLVVGDERVQQVSSFEPGRSALRDIRFEGGGGTDFTPLLQEAEKHRPDIGVVLTGLQGPANHRPRWPVIWAVPEEHTHVVAPFGRTLVLARGARVPAHFSTSARMPRGSGGPPSASAGRATQRHSCSWKHGPPGCSEGTGVRVRRRHRTTHPHRPWPPSPARPRRRPAVHPSSHPRHRRAPPGRRGRPGMPARCQTPLR
jgi:hypothetical protein